MIVKSVQNFESLVQVLDTFRILTKYTFYYGIKPTTTTCDFIPDVTFC